MERPWLRLSGPLTLFGLMVASSLFQVVYNWDKYMRGMKTFPAICKSIVDLFFYLISRLFG